MTYSQNIQKAEYEILYKMNEEIFISEDYMLEGKTYFGSDLENNIYLASKSSCTIKKYSKDGEFITKFGRRGRGPGEFLTINSILVHNKLIFVFDMINTRVTTFDLHGSLMDTETLDYSEINWPVTRITSVGDDRFLLNTAINDNGNFLHLVNTDFSNIASWGQNLVKYFDNESIDKSTVGSYYPSTLIINETQFIYVPFLYYGRMYQYDFSTNQQLTIIREVDGFVDMEKPYEEFDPSQKDVRFSGKGHRGSSSFAYILNNSSDGIYRVKSDTYSFVHFTRITVDGVRLFGYELYDKEYNYVGYFILKRIKTDKNGFAGIRYGILGNDNEGYFYFIDSSEIPTLLKAKLNDVN